MGKDRDAVTCLAALACGYFADGQVSRAAILFGAADGLLERVSVGWSPYDEETYRRYRAETQAAMSEELFKLDWDRGQAMREEEAMALALSGK